MYFKKFKTIKNNLTKKADNNIYVTYPIIAIGVNKSGDIIGMSSNKVNFNDDKKGNGLHAERELIKKFGRSIKTIILYRKGFNGSCLPIHPCKVCKKVCDKLNIKICSVQDLFNDKF